MHPGAVQSYLTALFTYFEAIVSPEPDNGILHHSVEDWPIIFTLNVTTDADSQAILSNIPTSPSRLQLVKIPCHSTGPKYLGLPDGVCVISANRCLGFGLTGTQEEKMSLDYTCKLFGNDIFVEFEWLEHIDGLIFDQRANNPVHHHVGYCDGKLIMREDIRATFRSHM